MPPTKIGRAAHKKSEPKACAFCAIVRGEAPAFVVLDDEIALGFLDYRPLALGHVLLAPRTHYAVLADVPDEIFGALAMRAQRISAAVIAAMGAEGSFIALNNIVSQSVPHVHFHIVPRRQKDGVFTAGYVWRRASYADDAQRAEVAAKIRAALSP